jgi:chromosomal replication initiator protein
MAAKSFMASVARQFTSGLLVTEIVVRIPISGRSTSSAPAATAGSALDAPFSEYLIGSENALVPVAIEIALSPNDRAFNPIVLYGPLGVGKTHLAVGLVAAWKAVHRQTAALYMPALDFARALDDAIETQTVDDLRNRLSRLAFLAIDDVEYLVSKVSAQRELVSLLDGLIERDSRVLATCSTSPAAQMGLLPGLASRLAAGLTVPVEPPNQETRLASIGCLAQWRGVTIEEAAAHRLAAGVRGGMAALWSVISELASLLGPDSRTITAEMVQRRSDSRPPLQSPSIRDITAATARHFAVKMADLRSPSRRRAVVAARDVAMYLARTITGESFKQIGSYFDGRDHTTVSHGFAKTENLVQTDPTIREAVRQLRERLGFSESNAR